MQLPIFQQGMCLCLPSFLHCLHFGGKSLQMMKSAILTLEPNA